MDVIIIGNGITGITAARTIRKLSNYNITVISAESDYFFARTALMYVFMGHMRMKDLYPYEHWFWSKNKITLVRDTVSGIELKSKKVFTSSGKSLPYDKLVIATGSIPAKLNIPGETFEGVRSFYALQDLEYVEMKSRYIHHAVIVGGGLIGIELAEMFHSRNIPVTMLVRESGYANNFLPEEESLMVNTHIRKHGIDLKLDTSLKEIKSDPSGHVASVLTSSGEDIPCQFVGVSIGVQPNIAWLEDTNIEVDKGILVDEFLQTNLTDIYAAGDCAQLKLPSPERRAIEPLWYAGRHMGEYVAQSVCGCSRKFDQGIWFNSAKFFDIEYQVYGNIQTSITDDQATLYWQHPTLEKSVRINYTPDAVIGFQGMGIRLRQDVCEKWIRTNSKIESVLATFELALFDQEFSTNYAIALRETYHALTGTTITPLAKRSINQVKTFLKNLENSFL